jgi:hypothetical protein
MDAFFGPFGILMYGVPTLMAASHFILTVTVAMLVMKLLMDHGDLAGNNGPPPPPQQRRLFDVLGRVQLMLGGLGSGPPLGLVPGHPPPPTAAGAPLPAAPGPHGVFPKQLYEEVFDVLEGLAVSEVNDLLSHAREFPSDEPGRHREATEIYEDDRRRNICRCRRGGRRCLAVAYGDGVTMCYRCNHGQCTCNCRSCNPRGPRGEELPADLPLRLFGCLADDNEHDFHHGGSNPRAARGQCIICGLLYTFHMRELRLKVFRTRRCCQ